MKTLILGFKHIFDQVGRGLRENTRLLVDEHPKIKQNQKKITMYPTDWQERKV